jgi:putative endonuclease
MSMQKSRSRAAFLLRFLTGRYTYAMQWFVYMIKGANSHFYTGVTVDMERRLDQHNGDLIGGARATRKFRPYSLAYLERADSRSDAQKRESALKRLTHMEKAVLSSTMKKAHLKKMLVS